MLPRVVVASLVCVVIWVALRASHRYRVRPETGYHLLKGPRWLALICGYPLADGQVELAAAVGQVTSIMSAATILGLALLGVQGQAWTLVAGVGCAAPAVAGFVTRLAIMLVKRVQACRRHVRGK